MKKSLKVAPALLVPFLAMVFPPSVAAVCPVCTAAVVAGLGLSRWLGVDDTVSGVWIGGVLLSSSLWFFDWLTKKWPKIKKQSWQVLTVVATYAFVFVPLATADIIGHPFNRIWGIDKLIVGTTIGSIAFLLGTWLDKKERQLKEKILFPYQKVIFPVTLLIIASVALYFVTKR